MPSNQLTHAMTRFIMDCPLYKVLGGCELFGRQKHKLVKCPYSIGAAHTSYRVFPQIKIQNFEVNTRVRGHIDINYISFVRCGELATEV